MARNEDTKNVLSLLLHIFSLIMGWILATGQNCHAKGECNLRKCQRCYSQQRQGDIDGNVRAGVCSSGILHTLLVIRDWGGWIQTALGAERTAKIFREWESWDNVNIFPFYFPFLLAPVTFPAAGSLSCSPGKAAQAQGTPAPSQSPLFTTHFPKAVTRNFCNKGAEGGGPVDNLSGHTHPSCPKKWKSRHTRAAEPRQVGNSASVLPFGLGAALTADWYPLFGLIWELKLQKHRTVVHGFLGESPQLPETGAGDLSIQPREGCGNALAREVQLSHQALVWIQHETCCAAALGSYTALSGVLLGNVKSTCTGTTAAATLRTVHQPILFINCTLTKKVGINFVHVKKTQSQFFLLHNLGTWASAIKQCARQRMVALSTPFSLWHQREMEQTDPKKLNNIQESIKVIKADSLILFYTYFSKKSYISKHNALVLDVYKPALLGFILW